MQLFYLVEYRSHKVLYMVQAMSYKAETVRLRQYVVKLEEQGRLLAKEAMHWRTKWTQSNYQSMQMYNELSATSRVWRFDSQEQALPT